MKQAAVAPIFLALVSCVPTPDSYPVPVQHTPVTAPEPLPEREIIEVSDPRAESFFIAEVNGLEGGGWRWTGENPRFRFQIGDPKPRKLLVAFSIHPMTFKDTGPLHVAYYVNGNLLTTAVYNAPGDYVFENPVPPEWLRPHNQNEIRIHIENPWIAPADKAKLGILLHRVGFLG